MADHFTRYCAPPCEILAGILGLLLMIALAVGVLIALNLRKLQRRRDRERLEAVRASQVAEFDRSRGGESST